MGKINIIEKFIEGKKDSKSCEDYIFHNDSYIAVIDGVTSKSDIFHGSLSGGQIAANIVIRNLEKSDKKISIDSFIKNINNDFISYYLENGIYDDVLVNKFNRCQCCCIIYQIETNTLWSIGDCKALVDNEVVEDFNKKVDVINSEARALYINSEIEKGCSIESFKENDTGRKYILELIKRGMQFSNSENKEWGYGVVDGFDIPNHLIKVIKLEDDVREIVLSSDGYLKLYNSLEESERFLFDYIDYDPLFIKEYKSTKGYLEKYKSYDDRAYIRFERVL